MGSGCGNYPSQAKSGCLEYLVPQEWMPGPPPLSEARVCPWCPPGGPGNGHFPAAPHLPPTSPSLGDSTVACVLKPLDSPGPPSWVLPGLHQPPGEREARLSSPFCHQLALNIQQVMSGTGPQCPGQLGRAVSRRAVLPPRSSTPGGGGRERSAFRPQPALFTWAGVSGEGREVLLSRQPERGTHAGAAAPPPPTPRPLAAGRQGSGRPGWASRARPPEPGAHRAFQGGRRSSGGSRSLPGRPAAHGGAGSNLGRNGSGAEATAPRGPVPAAASLAAPPAGLIAESGLIGNANGN